MISHMKVISIENESMEGIHQGEKYDFDRYMIELKSQLSTQEFTVVVCHIDKEISGDVIRYGSWDNLMEDELLKLLSIVEKEGKLIRPFNNYKA